MGIRKGKPSKHFHLIKWISIRKKNDKRFNNRGYSLFFLMGIFLKHLWLIPNILKWQDCKIFTKLVPSQTLLRSSHRKCSVKKGVFKNLRKFTGKHLCWSLFLIKLRVFRPATLLNSDSNTQIFSCTICEIFKNTYFEEHLQTTASAVGFTKLFPLTSVKTSFSV